MKKSEYIYAIGDIHGQLNKLAPLLKIIGKEESATFVFIGDYIDRGPKSKEVIDLLIKFSQDHKCVFLKGNHESLLENARGYLTNKHQHHETFMLWLMNGGDQTCKSYKGFENIFELHSAFLENLKLYYETPDYIFVHAGLKPGIPLQEQSEEDLLWIRDEFIINPTNYPKKTIIYGHTITEMCVSPYADKIGIDTGAGFGGKLTALKLPSKKLITI